MTAADLTAIVESVAREQWNATADKYEAISAQSPKWDDLAEFDKATMREATLPFVTATLRALTPMAEGWVALAKDNRDIAERFEMCGHDAEDDHDDLTATARFADARVAYTAGNTLLSCAKALRELIEGAK